MARLGIVAVTAATVVCVAACGSSNNQNTGKPTSSLRPTSSAPTSPPAPPKPTDHVEGMISSFSGNTINLRLRQGTATVDFSPSTEIIETTPGQLGDVTTDNCVDVRPAPAGAPGAITAQSVTISPVVDGKCPPPPGPSSAAPPGNPGVNGKVDSVSGNTITVASTEANGSTTQTKVTVTDTTTYSKATPTDTAALTSGKCMSAEGTKDSSGVLHATTIDLQPCPPMGRPQHRIPHIPHIPMPHHHHG
ncbi:MAG: hypothetical protein JOZ23_19785 [Mycobacterium sp.]|nr:hypothetical protein [Mycobacterium sp.]